MAGLLALAVPFVVLALITMYLHWRWAERAVDWVTSLMEPLLDNFPSNTPGT
jgi:nitrate reductase gamma subunit